MAQHSEYVRDVFGPRMDKAHSILHAGGTKEDNLLLDQSLTRVSLDDLHDCPTPRGNLDGTGQQHHHGSSREEGLVNGPEKIAKCVWEIGKELGVSTVGSNQNTVDALQILEIRDRKAVGRVCDDRL
ncbi:ABC transporter substrate-binding protein [Sesbania bispinosa]|nr:ABC transporter substrate-binding protein [Sesbania bispinosa]